MSPDYSVNDVSGRSESHIFPCLPTLRCINSCSGDRDGLTRYPGIEHVRVQIGPIRPANRAKFGINTNFREFCEIFQWGEHAIKSNQLGYVDFTLCAVIEP